jgi:hypothetical protein
MKIVYLENTNRNNIKELYIGNQKRLATASGIQFIDKRYFIVCSMAGCKLYLYSINDDKNDITLLHSIDTTYDDKLSMTDLISYRNGLVVGSNFNEGTQTMYKIDGNIIKHYKDIPNMNKKKNFCHGIKFYNDTIICVTNNKMFGINFIDIIKDKLLFVVKLKNPYDDPKDIEFINKTNSNKMFILATTSKVLTTGKPMVKSKKQNHMESNNIGKIIYCDIDVNNKKYDVLNEFVLNNSHTDSIVFYKNLIFVNNQISHTIDILFLQNEKIHYFRALSGFSFPHGITIEPNNNLLAVCNYGTNSVNIINLPDDVLNLIKSISC